MEKVWVCLSGDTLAADVPAAANEGMEAIVFGSFLRLLERLPDHIQTGWVPLDGDRAAWAVIVGPIDDDLLPAGADAPMRNAVALAWHTAMRDASYQYMRSGWHPIDHDRVRESAKEWFGSTSVFA